MKLQTLYESSIIEESFKDLERHLEDFFHGDAEGVQRALTVIKTAKDRNLLPRQYNDIGQIIKLMRNDPNAFSDLMINLNTELMNREKKKQKFAQDKFHYRASDLVVVEPSSHESSCKYGANTTWCTTMRDVPDHFIEYTSYGGRLIYLLTDSRKFAIWLTPHGGVQLYDHEDDTIAKEEIRNALRGEYDEWELEDLLDNIQDQKIQDIFKHILG